MLVDVSGRVAIVTGAGRGIGRVIARRLVGEGATSIVADMDEGRVADAAAEWQRDGLAGAAIRCDVRDKADCLALAAEVERRFGRIDILVNNAGIATGGPLETLDQEIWDQNFAANARGAFLAAQAVIPVMKRRRWGRIVNAASYAAITPAQGSGAYAASKAAVESFTRTLAGELGPFDITVNAYAPGMIPTEMNHYADLPEATQQLLLDTLTLRRWGDAEDVADLVCFLASDRARYITGTMIDISGGKFATQMPWRAYRSA